MGFTLKIDKIIDLVLAANTSYIYCKNRQIIDPILVTNACVCVCVCSRARAYFSLFSGKKYLTKQANKQQYYKTKDSYIAFVVLRLHRQLKVVPDATDERPLSSPSLSFCLSLPLDAFSTLSDAVCVTVLLTADAGKELDGVSEGVGVLDRIVPQSPPVVRPRTHLRRRLFCNCLSLLLNAPRSVSSSRDTSASHESPYSSRTDATDERPLRSRRCFHTSSCGLTGGMVRQTTRPAALQLAPCTDSALTVRLRGGSEGLRTREVRFARALHVWSQLRTAIALRHHCPALELTLAVARPCTRVSSHPHCH